MGFARAGFNVMLGVDTDLDSLVSFSWAHPLAEVSQVPVEDHRWKLGVEVVIGGPPCQPWSTGGNRRGAEDGRDGWPGFVSAIRQIKPRAFVAENVLGFAGTPEMMMVLRDLREAGFAVDCRVLDAADFGVPQHRKRLFIVGTRTGVFRWPQPTDQPRPAGHFIGLGGVGEPNPAKVTWSKNPVLRKDPYAGMLVNGGGRPINLRRPAPTVLASASGNKAPWVDTYDVVPNVHRYLMEGGTPITGEVTGARRLTAEELALLQSFPAGHKFAGSRSSQVRQIGNAVPPRVAQRIAVSLASCLMS
jgi:DNA (cytosine-5)-methyltransferase 1